VNAAVLMDQGAQALKHLVRHGQVHGGESLGAGLGHNLKVLEVTLCACSG
jgi:hypothetical protein